MQNLIRDSSLCFIRGGTDVGSGINQTRMQHWVIIQASARIWFRRQHIETDPESGRELARIPWSVEAGHKLAYLPYKATTWRVPEVLFPEVARLCA